MMRRQEHTSCQGSTLRQHISVAGYSLPPANIQEYAHRTTLAHEVVDANAPGLQWYWQWLHKAPAAAAGPRGRWLRRRTLHGLHRFPSEFAPCPRPAVLAFASLPMVKPLLFLVTSTRHRVTSSYPLHGLQPAAAVSPWSSPLVMPRRAVSGPDSPDTPASYRHAHSNIARPSVDRSTCGHARQCRRPVPTDSCRIRAHLLRQQ